MKVRLYKVHLQDPKYSGEQEDVTVHAPNIKRAIDIALKITWISHKKLNLVQSVELIGVAEN